MNEEKYDYIKRVKERYKIVAESIGFWKLSKIKSVYPLNELEHSKRGLKGE